MPVGQSARASPGQEISQVEVILDIEKNATYGIPAIGRIDNSQVFLPDAYESSGLPRQGSHHLV
jgi:hypothetical protein